MGAFALWGLLPSPLRRLLVVVAVAGAAFAAGYLKADNRAKHAAEVASLEARLATAKADLETARIMEGAAKEKAADLEASEESNRNKINDLEANLAKRPASSVCHATDDDARRLRAIH